MEVTQTVIRLQHTIDIPFGLRELITAVQFGLQRSHYIAPVLLNDPCRILDEELETIGTAGSAHAVVKYKTHGVVIRPYIVRMTLINHAGVLRQVNMRNHIRTERCVIDILEAFAFSERIEDDAITERFLTGELKLDIEALGIGAYITGLRLRDRGRIGDDETEGINSRVLMERVAYGLGVITVVGEGIATPYVDLAITDRIIDMMVLGLDYVEVERVGTIATQFSLIAVIVHTGLVIGLTSPVEGLIIHDGDSAVSK